MSPLSMAPMSNWPTPLMRNICSVMMAPAKVDGSPKAATVTTGIMLLRSTWTRTTTRSVSPLARAVRT